MKKSAPGTEARRAASENVSPQGRDGRGEDRRIAQAVGVLGGSAADLAKKDPRKKQPHGTHLKSAKITFVRSDPGLGKK